MNFLKTILNIKTFFKNNRSRYMDLVLYAILTGVVAGLFHILVGV
tara:strand:+ start:133 stop:267 length:135 start_codon:yes stop_codon:yes gene_type:complete